MNDVGERYCNGLFVDFLYLLRDYGVPASPEDLLELNAGLEKGVVEGLDDLFVFSRLVFVRRVEHMDAFERAFLLYFYGVDVPPVAEGDLELLNTKQFREWLERQIAEGKLPRRQIWQYDPEELMQKFWDTLREQLEEHHGGSKWVGTKGNSPFGHSGNAERGVRVGGGSRNRSALKVLGERRYVQYSDRQQLREENLRQALESMKHMKNEGPRDRLNLDETIRRTAKDGGEIDLVFERDLRDKISVILLIDNGGYSMTPFVNITRLLFAKLHERFEDLTTYYFHNSIYERVWSDYRRLHAVTTESLLQRRPDVRVVIMGDATMAPEELESWGGSISSFGGRAQLPSTYWLDRIAERFRHTCWLNPVPREYWGNTYGAYTLNRMRDLFHMEDMTLGGIKGMVEFMGIRN
ncbi:MAG: hypothetical protein HYV26_19165 [Candidatus Hydrogenedentes bacterium]|nr:hypothetical protein [Candidatus Hydrogenedentota bacterium]MBI3117526.1 hypothetical protein [Candidatus Hydrogenedentota bacterium]